MPRLTALTVKSAKPGRHADGGGLYLLVKPTGARSWVLRVQVDGKRRDVGLGTVDISPRSSGRGEASPIAIPLLQRKILTLSEAREKSVMLRDAAKAGLDPVVERDRARRGTPTFREAAVLAHDALKAGWAEKGAKTFLAMLENHAFQTLGDIRVNVITAGDISNTLTPIWSSKPDIARKVRQRIGTVLNYAHGKGWRPTEAPGRSVTVGLPRQPKSGSFSAMPYADVPAFVEELAGKTQTIGRQALLFQLLTAARPGEVRAARWGQVNFDKREWNRPASIMKTGIAHMVTLSGAAIALLERMKAECPAKSDGLIFFGSRGAALSDMTMNKVLRASKLPYDAHGFRSSFRTWAAEKMPGTPEPVAEKALAHAVPDAVERAYQRAEFVDMRRVLLEAWAAHVMGGAQHG